MGRAFLVPGADFSASNLGTVTPKNSIVIRELDIVGPSVINTFSQQYSASYTPEYTTQKGVTWSIVSGGTYVSINSNGILSVNPDTVSQDIVIRCASTSNNSIYAEKTVNVTYQSAVFVQKNYLENTGSSYLFLDDFAATDLYGATIESRGKITNGNGYLLAYRNDSNATSMRFAHYRQNSGNMAYLLGTSDFHGAGIAAGTSTFKYIFTLSSTSSAKDASLKIYKGSSTSPDFSIASGSYTCYMSGSLSIFGLGYTPHGGPNTVNSNTIAQGRFYSASITKDGVTIANYVPGTADGVPCIKNTVTGKIFLDATNNGDLVVG